MKRIEDNIIFENCRLIYRNFSGVARPPFNAEGNRNFCVVIEDEEFAHKLADDGWNVKFKDPSPDGMIFDPYLQVKVKYSDDRPWSNPRVMMDQGENKVYLNQDTIHMLDNLEIINVKALEIRPYNYDTGQMQGVTAYLKNMRIEVARDMFCD